MGLFQDAVENLSRVGDKTSVDYALEKVQRGEPVDSPVMKQSVVAFAFACRASALAPGYVSLDETIRWARKVRPALEAFKAVCPDECVLALAEIAGCIMRRRVPAMSPCPGCGERLEGEEAYDHQCTNRASQVKDTVMRQDREPQDCRSFYGRLAEGFAMLGEDGE